VRTTLRRQMSAMAQSMTPIEDAMKAKVHNCPHVSEGQGLSEGIDHGSSEANDAGNIQ
jgi:hypothetical protein